MDKARVGHANCILAMVNRQPQIKKRSQQEEISLYAENKHYCLLGEPGLSCPGGAAQRVECAPRTLMISGIGLGTDPPCAGSRSGDLI